jgi:hypothetical protein
MQGVVLYRGPSVIDQAPIVAIATGLINGARNAKTGPMVQIYILRSDQNPLKAVQTGDDRSICGDCVHRGRIIIDPKTDLRRNLDRSCYVTVMHGPRIVYDSFQRDLYPEVPLKQARRLLANRRVRLGAYGDPGAVPIEVWSVSLDLVDGLTGYTHLWRDHPQLSNWCMASCDTEAEREEAKALGFRTFRVMARGEIPIKGEGRCPASEELNKAVQCIQCMLCGGNQTKAKADITITVHGTGAPHFNRVKTLA